MRHSKEAQGAGETSASFTLDVFSQFVGSKRQQSVTVRRHKEQGTLQLHLHGMYCGKFLAFNPATRDSTEAQGTRETSASCTLDVSLHFFGLSESAMRCSR